MGLIGGMARTAVIAGTATAVSNRVSRRQARRWGAQEEQSYAAPPPQQQAPAYYPPQQQVVYEPAPVAPPAPEDPTIAQLQKLAGLHSQGILTDEEFASAKAKLLGI
jgi:hypothetical protein